MYKTKHYSAAETEAFPRINWFLDWALRGEDRRRREEGGGRKRNKSDRWTVLKCTKSMPFNGDYFSFYSKYLQYGKKSLLYRLQSLRFKKAITDWGKELHKSHLKAFRQRTTWGKLESLQGILVTFLDALCFPLSRKPFLSLLSHITAWNSCSPLPSPKCIWICWVC